MQRARQWIRQTPALAQGTPVAVHPGNPIYVDIDSPQFKAQMGVYIRGGVAVEVRILNKEPEKWTFATLRAVADKFKLDP